MDVRSWKIRFVPLSSPGDGEGSSPRQPGLPVPTIEEVEFRDTSELPATSVDEILLISVPTATEITAASQRALETWARTRSTDDDPVIETSLRTVRAICSLRRALVFADEHMTDAVDGLVRMLNVHRELTRLETDVADHLCGCSPSSAGRRQAGFGFDRSLDMKLRYLRLRSAVERPDGRASIWSSRLFLELATAARLTERLDAAEEPIQAFHELAEAAHSRSAERSHFVVSTIVETAIAMLLAADLLLVVLR